MSPGTMTFLSTMCSAPGSCTKARQNLTSFISLAAYLRYHSSSATVPPLAFDIRNGSSPAAMIGKRPGV